MLHQNNTAALIVIIAKEIAGRLFASQLLSDGYFFESPGILLCQYVKELTGKGNVSGDERQDQNGMSRFWIHRFHGFRFLSRFLLIFWNCHNRPSPRLFPVTVLSPSCASGFAFACMEKSRTFSLWEVLIFCNCQC